MVRRWSSINIINKHSLTQFKTFQRASTEVLFRENLSFRKELRKVSFMTRKSWSRRKHIGQWLIYHNIMANWSADYRFFKKYNKSMLIQNLFTNSFLTYNFLMLKKANTGSFVGSEHFLYSFTTKKVYHYFLKYQTTSFNIFNFVKNYNLFLMTQPTVKQAFLPANLTQLQTTYNFSQNALFSSASKPTDNTHLLEIHHLLTQLVLINSVDLYKTFTMLTFLNAQV